MPIIKFQDIQSGVNFDISFDAANGPEAAEYVRALMQKLPPMRPLLLILKVFLHQRELNEVRYLRSSTPKCTVKDFLQDCKPLERVRGSKLA